MAHERNIQIRSVRRAHPDLRKLSRALITLALQAAQAEADAHAAHAGQPADAAPRPDTKPATTKSSESDQPEPAP